MTIHGVPNRSTHIPKNDDQNVSRPADLVSWFVGPGAGCRGARLVAVEVNGTAGFGNYRLTRPGLWEPFGIQVIEVVDGAIAGHHNYLYPQRFAELGLPPRLEGDQVGPDAL